MSDLAIVCFWNADNREVGWPTPSDILAEENDGTVIEIEEVAIVRSSFQARLPAADDADSDDDFDVCADTREEAERLIQAELDRRAALNECAATRSPK